MEQVKNAFNCAAREYDALREHVIPELRRYYVAAVWACDCPKPDPAILDIGAGTGLFSACVLEKFPAARMTLMDISEKMLELARERFRSRENVRYVVCDYSRADLGGQYDLCCSALSIHHLESEDKKRLFQKIFAALKPGGLFVNADQADGETPYFRQRNLHYWNEFLESGPLGITDHVEILRRRDLLDKNEKLSVQLDWLHDCGFVDVDVVYKNRTFIVTVARKG